MVPAALKARVEGKYGSKAASVDVGGKIDRYSPKKTIELEYSINMPIQPKSISGKPHIRVDEDQIRTLGVLSEHRAGMLLTAPAYGKQGCTLQT